MKIGIMSMQRIVNYGSFLQSYSLKKIIEKMGHEVVFVDFHPGKVIVPVKSASKRRRLMRKIVYKIKNPRTIIRRKDIIRDEISRQKYNQKFKEELLPILGVGFDDTYNESVDALIIGSDEVFNCLQTNENVGYSLELFGKNANAKTINSYAASFGNTTIEGIKKYGIDKEISTLLLKFNNLSVRDKNSFNIVTKLTGVIPQYHLDPVFLYDYEEMFPKEKILKDYLVVYAYHSRIKENEAKDIKRFAKKSKKKIICLCEPQPILGNYVAATPFEILWYIKNADFVVTDTFHGTVFSIKYNKKFVTYVRDDCSHGYGNKEKLSDLLNRFELEERSISDGRIEDIICKDYDYEKVNRIILEERNKSLAYIKKIIQETE